HQIRYRQFKSFYLHHVCQHLRAEFPTLLSYSRCIELLPRCAMALHALFETIKGKCTGISIVDSTPIAVCDNLRIKRHRVFRALAERGKSSTGWFFGFKLHTVINHLGELLSIRLTRGNGDDRKPVPDLVRGFFGRLYADKGYISKILLQQLKEKGVTFITRARRNMKPYILIISFQRLMIPNRSLGCHR
ncbi:Transposase DDE protein, partial [Candidatus Regiella insecticola 5.15]